MCAKLMYSSSFSVYIYITNILMEITQNQPVSLVFKSKELSRGVLQLGWGIVGGIWKGGSQHSHAHCPGESMDTYEVQGNEGGDGRQCLG